MGTATARITPVKERPILFNEQMVNAILSGRKTQTRRVIKPQPPAEAGGLVLCDDGETWMDYPLWVTKPTNLDLSNEFVCPLGGVGGRLWVREAFSEPLAADEEAKNFTGFYRATDSGRSVKWRPSIHMPRWASRLSLVITGVGAERLQDITEADAQAEGFTAAVWPSAVADFATTWDSIYGEVASWESNPWVWAITFERLAPLD